MQAKRLCGLAVAALAFIHDRHRKNIAPAEFASHIHLMKFVALTVEIITHASYNDKWYYYGQGSCIKDYGNPRWIE